MTEEIRRAVIEGIYEKFQLPVYGQKVPQGGKKPCFTVELEQTEQKRLLGNRAARKVTAAVRYYSGAESAAEGLEAADGLYEALLLIGKEEKFAASSMQHEKTEDGVKFTAAYEYHVLLEEEKAELMQRLKYNGKGAVGYEEE